jgi:GGDEF domain-containing protein
VQALSTLITSGVHVYVTVSIGVAVSNAALDEHDGAVLERADAELREAKAARRNAVSPRAGRPARAA